jgi:hypothetical protein
MNQLIVYEFQKMTYFTDEFIMKLYYILLGYIIGYMVSTITVYRIDAQDEYNISNVRDLIDDLYERTNNRDDFVSFKSIVKKLNENSGIYPISKQMIKDALLFEPYYAIGYKYKKMGYRYIKLK